MPDIRGLTVSMLILTDEHLCIYILHNIFQTFALHVPYSLNTFMNQTFLLIFSFLHNTSGYIPCIMNRKWDMSKVGHVHSHSFEYGNKLRHFAA